MTNVGNLFNPNGVCTGSLITDRVVLFAGHCLEAIAERCTPKNPSVSGNFLVTPGGDVTGGDGTTLEIDDVAVFPGAYDPAAGTCPVGSPGWLSCGSFDTQVVIKYGSHIGNDVALAHLSRPAPSALGAPLRVLTGVTDTRDLGFAVHFKLDPDVVFGSSSPVLPTVVGFDGRTQRSAAFFHFAGAVDTYDVFPCDGNAVSLTEPAIRLHDITATVDHGDSGGPVVVFGGTGQNQLPQLPPGAYVVGVLSHGLSDHTTAGVTFGPAGPWIEAMLRDWDGDSVENAVDDCPTVPDPTQANCNKDAEVAWNINHSDTPIPVLGDACDPVPCPASSTNRVVATETAVGNCSAPSSGFDTRLCIGRQIRNQIDLAPIGAHAITGAIQGGVGELPIPAVQTAARFCEQNATLKFDCTSAVNTRFEGLDLLEGNIKTTDRPWHRISVSPSRAVVLPNRSFPRGQEFFFDYGPSTRPTLNWDYVADDTFWHSSAVPAIPPPDSYPQCTSADFGPGTCLDGRLWFFGRTLVGGDDAHTTVGGIRIGNQAPHISGHYFPARPDATIAAAFGTPRLRLPFYLIRTLPDPPPPDGGGLTRFDAGEAFPLVAESAGLFAVRDDFSLDDVSRIVDPILAASFADPGVRWLPAVEPSPFSGPPAAPVGAALSLDGTAVQAFAFLVNGRLTSLTGFDPPAPPPRAGYSAVYSRMAHGVFVAGGLDSGGNAVDQIWFFDVDTNAWSRLAVPAGALGTVLSITYAWKDSGLWILDEQDGGRRLLRFDLATGELRVIAGVDNVSLHSASHYDSRGLLVDVDGALLVFAAGLRTDDHRIARITPTVAPTPGISTPLTFEVAITPTESRALAVAPIVDLRGVRLIFEPSPTNGKAIGHGNPHAPKATEEHDLGGLRLPTLQFEKGNLDELASLLR